MSAKAKSPNPFPSTGHSSPRAGYREIAPPNDILEVSIGSCRNLPLRAAGRKRGGHERAGGRDSSVRHGL